jgi:hypothetical protein
MSQNNNKHSAAWKLAMVCLFPATMFLTGCQVEMGGQTLPSPWYLTDDVQYYAPGSEFKLQHEATAMQEQNAAIKSKQQSAMGN